MTNLALMGQPMRLLRFLRLYPGATSLEITIALHLVNVTGRISDLRAAGYVIDCRRDGEGRDRYWLVEAPEQQRLAL